MYDILLTTYYIMITIITGATSANDVRIKGFSRGVVKSRGDTSCWTDTPQMKRYLLTTATTN